MMFGRIDSDCCIFISFVCVHRLESIKVTGGGVLHEGVSSPHCPNRWLW